MDSRSDELALHTAQSPKGNDIVRESKSPQAVHRLDIVEAWNCIQPGHRILELGCGQGDMTEVLASLVGPNGHVVALDPADPVSYGSPWTLKQAQDHISASEIGNRIQWVRSDTIQYLEKTGSTFDVVVLAQCLWYFSSTEEIANTLRSIKKLEGSPRLLLAEYALESRHPEAMPHILAAFARASVEVHKITTDSNIRTLSTPQSLRQLAEEAGWKLVSQKMITPAVAYEDARWEVGPILRQDFLQELNDVVKEERAKSVAIALRDAVIASAAQFERKTLRSMDVWAASFE